MKRFVFNGSDSISQEEIEEALSGTEPMTEERKKAYAPLCGRLMPMLQSAIKAGFRGVSRNHPHADEVSSLSMKALMRALDGYEKRLGNFSTYLFGGVRLQRQAWNYASDNVLRLQGAPTASPLLELDRDRRAVRDPDPFHAADRKAEAEDLVSLLSPRLRAVIRMRFWGGLTLKEIGEEMGVALERIRQLEMKGLQHLRQVCLRRSAG